MFEGMSEDDLRRLREIFNGDRQWDRYCQRCEEPRFEEEFPPFKLGVCLHCLRSMKPGELSGLFPHGTPKL